MEYEEEDVSRYWVTVRKREDTVDRKRKHCIALCGEFALDEAMDQSQGRQQDELINERLILKI